MNTPQQKSALLIILDGMGDRPCSKLNGVTPLEYASLPEMDRLVEQGICGLAYPLAPGLPVDTHTGTATLFGFSRSATEQLARGPVEAAGVGMEIGPRDVVLRANFASFNQQYRLLDRRAGRINEGTEALSDSINQIPPIDGVHISFKPATGHRGVVRNPDPGRVKLENTPQCTPLSADSDAKRTAAIVNQWSQAVFEILDQHPVNQQRRKQSLLLANGVILRGAGEFQTQNNLLKELDIKPVVISAEATVHGLAALSGFDSINLPSFTALPDTDIAAKVEAAEQALSHYPLVILHFKAPDICAHDFDPVAKANFIQAVDQALPALSQKASAIAITADHSTSSESGHHCGDPVPSLLYYPGVRRDHCSTFSEVSCMQGGLGTIPSSSLLLMLLDGLGWIRNYKVKDRWMLQ